MDSQKMYKLLEMEKQLHELNKQLTALPTGGESMALRDRPVLREIFMLLLKQFLEMLPGLIDEFLPSPSPSPEPPSSPMP